MRAATSVDLDQWATLDDAWQNGNLNGNNTRYPEGGIVPFRIAIEGLKAGAHSIRIQYDFTAGGHKAYDFLAPTTAGSSRRLQGQRWRRSRRCVPGMPSSSSAAFPSDPFKADGLTVRSAETYSGVSRRLTIWGGTISSISGPTHAGSTDGNSTAEFLVKFTSKGSAVLLAWGGHLAQSALLEPRAGGRATAPARSPAPRGTCARSSSTGRATATRTAVIQPSAIVGELPPFALARRRPRRDADADPAGCRGTRASGRHRRRPTAAAGRPDPDPAGDVDRRTRGRRQRGCLAPGAGTVLACRGDHLV